MKKIIIICLVLSLSFGTVLFVGNKFKSSTTQPEKNIKEEVVNSFILPIPEDKKGEFKKIQLLCTDLDNLYKNSKTNNLKINIKDIQKLEEKAYGNVFNFQLKHPLDLAYGLSVGYKDYGFVSFLIDETKTTKEKDEMFNKFSKTYKPEYLIELNKDNIVYYEKEIPVIKLNFKEKQTVYIIENIEILKK